MSSHKVWPPNGNLSQWMLDQFPVGYAGHAIDVGASDGISVNTTYALETAHRWTVLSVEANPFFSDRLKACRAFVEICACDETPGEAEFHVNDGNPEAYSSLRPSVRPDMHPQDGIRWSKITVPVRTLDQLIAKWEFPKLDALCVDVEGTELSVLKGFDLARWKPRVVISECWDRAGPADPYLESLGYKKTARNVHNDIFIRRAE